MRIGIYDADIGLTTYRDATPQAIVLIFWTKLRIYGVIA